MKNLLFAATLMSLTLSSSFATTTYTYTGNNYTTVPTSPFFQTPYSSNMSISGVLTLSSALAPSTTTNNIVPLSFSFFDGYQTIDNTLATNAQFSLRTNAAGNIDAWTISLSNANFNVILPPNRQFNGHSIFTGSNLVSTIDQGSILFNGTDGNNSRGFIQNSPGFWLSDVPEPSTFGLMAFGMAISAVLARRQKRRNPSCN